MARKPADLINFVPKLLSLTGMAPIVDIIDDNLVDSKMEPQPGMVAAGSAASKRVKAPAPTQSGLEAYRRLREAIVSGHFQPNERLVEASLVKELGSGRSAVRAALVRLDQEGLVTLERNRGARVRLISDREALEIEEVRAALEGLLAFRAAVSATEADLRDLRQVLVEMSVRLELGDSIGYSELNARFHQRIWAAADHPTAARLVGGLKSQGIRFQYQTILRPGRSERSMREHERIFSALVAHDSDGAEAAMREHLGEVLETLKWVIDGHRRAPRWAPD
jgi:DNA-binding GntR family transcriptional regulator